MTRKPKSPTTAVPTVAASMKQAATIWKIPLHAIKSAKASGCRAFERQRVHRAPLLRWLKSHPEALAAAGKQADTAELKRQKVAWEVANLKLRHENDLAELMPTSDFRRMMGELLVIVNAEAKNLLEADHFRVFSDRCESRFSESGIDLTTPTI